MGNSLYMGIDIGKESHVAAFLSHTLKHHAKKQPTRKFANLRTGFEQLLSSIPDPHGTHILVEGTGHYGRALIAYLQERGVNLYRITAKKRYGVDKTDRDDARALARMLWNQIELNAEPTDEAQRIYVLREATADVQKIQGFVQHHYELTREVTRRKNKLTALMDELFPEFTEVFKKPNEPKALWLRERFPTPADISSAKLSDLHASGLPGRPGLEKYALLQVLATNTIGTRNQERIESIRIEQRHLIKELHLAQEHRDELTALIEPVIAESRAGQILTSMIGIGPIHAARILCGIGNIENFEKLGSLRRYMGWSPKRSQTGSSYDRSSLHKGGNRMLKGTMYLVAISAIKSDPTWKALYLRLVARMCWFDHDKKKWRGRMKVVGRIAGQIIRVMYVLLKRDNDLVTNWQGSKEELPPPELYSVKKHILNRAGGKTVHAPTAQALLADVRSE
jgi:transposase